MTRNFLSVKEISEMSNDNLILLLARLATVDRYRKSEIRDAARICAELCNRGVVSDSFAANYAKCFEL